MTKEEYLSMLEKHYEKFVALKGHKNFYDYEVGFEEIAQEMNKELFEKSLGGLPQDRRKKKKFTPDMGKSA